jgi:sterol desaturase/sphingolipid hydroxylase (fatty acid hydroxylase superfamily)
MPHWFLSLIIDVVRLTIWLALLAVIFMPLERLFALHPQQGRRIGLAADLGLYFLNSLIPALLIGLPMAALVAVAHRIVPAAFYGWVAGLPLWLQLGATFLIGEFGFYWGHRLTHVSPILWRFHAVHHAPAHLDWLINTRAHPIDMIFTRLCGLAPLYLLGLAGRGAAEGNMAAILLVLGGTIWGFFLHANINWRLGPVEHLFATPRFHHWHHTQSGPLDRNFASMLPFLDRLFGTLYLPASAWPQDYGLRGENGAPVQPGDGMIGR